MSLLDLLNKQLLFLLRTFFPSRRGRRGFPRSQQIQPNLDPLYQRRNLLHRSKKTGLELRTGVLYRFHRPGQNPVDVQQLPAKTIRGVGHHTVHLLRLSARQVYNVRRVADHRRNFWLGVVQQNLHTRQDRPGLFIQVRHRLVQLLHGAPRGPKQRDQHRHLQQHRRRYQRSNPVLHVRPFVPPSGYSMERIPPNTSPKTLRLKILTSQPRAGTLPVRLPPPPKSFLCAAKPFPCRARSNRPRAPAIPAPFSAQNPCPHRPCRPEIAASHPRTSARTTLPPALPLPVQPKNKKSSNLRCQPCSPPPAT